MSKNGAENTSAFGIDPIFAGNQHESCMFNINFHVDGEHTVDGRNPKQPPGIVLKPYK